MWCGVVRCGAVGGICCDNILCCAVLCCAVLCCAVLCCAVLCCAVLCCAVLCCAVLRLPSHLPLPPLPSPPPTPRTHPQVLRITTSERELDLLFARFDDTKRGMLDYHNYLELLGFQKAARMERRR